MRLCMSVLTLPTSVKIVVGFKTFFSKESEAALFKTGAHKKMKSHAEKCSSMLSVAVSIIPSFDACFRASLFISNAIILNSGLFAFNALAMEPPINPNPINPICYLFIISSKCLYTLNSIRQNSFVVKLNLGEGMKWDVRPQIV